MKITDKMKTTTLCLFLLLLSGSISAQWKTAEKSRKEKPEWAGGAARNYLIVSASAPTIEAAKEQILISLKQQIVGTIATRIQSETTVRKNEVLTNDVSDYTEQRESFVKATLAHIPFVSEVSLSKATDFYWEKQYNKNTREYRYEYQLKYLFTDFDADDLVRQFNTRESGLDKRLTDYTEKSTAISSVEEIDRALNEFKAFSLEFATDDPRRTQVEQLANNYRQLYQAINIRQEEDDKQNTISIALYLSDRRISCSQKPQLKANCADKLTVTADEDRFIVKFSTENCYEEDENYIDIRFRFGNRIASQRVYIQKSEK